MSFSGQSSLADFDIDKLSFPTDNLSVRQIRAAFPADFQYDGNHKSNADFQFLNTFAPAIHNERALATQFFADHAKIALPSGMGQRPGEDLADMLADDYVKLGIASGPAHASELLRALERQVIAQVNNRTV